jgi:hypothetical protein
MALLLDVLPRASMKNYGASPCLIGEGAASWDFHNLTVWEKAHHLTLAFYKATPQFRMHTSLIKKLNADG